MVGCEADPRTRTVAPQLEVSVRLSLVTHVGLQRGCRLKSSLDLPSFDS